MNKILIYADTERIVESTLIYTGKGFLFSILIGTDTINDPVVAVYDDTDGDTAGNRIIPSNTYDASALGINGVVLKFAKKFSTGLYVSITNIGNGDVIVDYRTLNSMSKLLIC